MNIDQYREMKAQEEAETNQPTPNNDGGVPNAQVQQEPVATPEQNVQETGQIQPVVEQSNQQTTNEPKQEEAPSKVKYGDKEYEIAKLIEAQTKADELEKVAQNLSQQNQASQTANQYYQAMMNDPAYAKVFAEKNNLPYIDPQQQAVQELERKFQNVLLEREIDTMKLKYEDFQPKDVVKFAYDNKMKNLEDAYLLMKVKTGGTKEASASGDIASLKEQIRQELLNELKSDVNTSTIIGASGGGGKPVQDTKPELSPAEIKVAIGLGMSPDEYAKYKNMK